MEQCVAGRTGGGSGGAGSPVGAFLGHSMMPTALSIHPISAADRIMPSQQGH